MAEIFALKSSAIFFYENFEIAIKKTLHLQSEKIGKNSNKK